MITSSWNLPSSNPASLGRSTRIHLELTEWIMVQFINIFSPFGED